ncbi:hypothetical protein PG997_000997 [Apiospora hydei]|uniref:Uncharacterized protein n=1 Tax=Apiospora hydei TaxID=1337664 RepID=A0ABR1XCG7_9PEZI
MDELEAICLEPYIERGGYFEKPGPEYRYKAVTITSFPAAAAGPEHLETELAEDALAGFMASPSPVDENAQPVPRLQLISIETNLRGPRYMIDSQVFKGLFKAASISTGDLWLLVHDRKGFLSMRRSEYQETHFAGHTNYTMAWSFDRHTLCIRAIWINLFRDDERRDFTSLLKRFKRYISSPLLLGFIYCLDSSSLTIANAKIYYDIERSVGYYGFGNDRAATRPSRVDLSELTRHISMIHNHIHLTSYFHYTANTSLQILSELEAHAGAVSLEEVASDPIRQRMHSTTLRLSQAFPVVRSRLLVRKEEIQRHMQRGRELSNLLFVLLTHEDALKGADLAKLGAEIAEASKRDSASMKTVAVLTMAFLPATFFAALFAIPSLDWKAGAAAATTADGSGSVIQSNFWVYWAFTLPATVLIFVIWLILNNRKWLVGAYKERVLCKRMNG